MLSVHELQPFQDIKRNIRDCALRYYDLLLTLEADQVTQVAQVHELHEDEYLTAVAKALIFYADYIWVLALGVQSKFKHCVLLARIVILNPLDCIEMLRALSALNEMHRSLTTLFYLAQNVILLEWVTIKDALTADCLQLFLPLVLWQQLAQLGGCDEVHDFEHCFGIFSDFVLLETDVAQELLPVLWQVVKTQLSLFLEEDARLLLFALFQATLGRELYVVDLLSLNLYDLIIDVLSLDLPA